MLILLLHSLFSPTLLIYSPLLLEVNNLWVLDDFVGGDHNNLSTMCFVCGRGLLRPCTWGNTSPEGMFPDAQDQAEAAVMSRIKH